MSDVRISPMKPRHPQTARPAAHVAGPRERAVVQLLRAVGRILLFATLISVFILAIGAFFIYAVAQASCGTAGKN